MWLSGCAEKEPTLPSSTIDININQTEPFVFGDDLNELQTNFPAFADVFYGQIVPIKQDEQTLNQEAWEAFKTDPFIVELHSKTDSVFKDFSSFEKTLAFGLEIAINADIIDQVPSIYTFISGLSYQCFLFDDGENEGLGIGLDMFLGKSFPYDKLASQNPAFSAYISRAFNKDHVAKKALETLIDDRLGDLKGSSMLDHMIQNGKKLYMLDQLMPTVHDSIIHEYTDKQLEWCEQNQQQIWAQFLRDDLFYQTNIRKFNKLINPSPNSPGMPAEAPGRTANFLGWKIVESYMDRNPDKNLKDLILWQDNKALFEQSKYKPT